MKGWRRDAMGGEIVKMFNGDGNYTLQWRDQLSVKAVQ